jgi:hypothetical protein
MAERVEVVRVGTEPRVRSIEKMSPEIHSAGIYKAVETNSWKVGIEVRQHKLTKINKAAGFVKEVLDEFAEWCIENGLTINWTIGGMYVRAIALLLKAGEKIADLYVNEAIPAPYRGFWQKAKQMFKNRYAEVRQ